MRREMACMLLKLATDTRVRPASVLPASMASAAPRRIISIASPMALLPVAQAVEIAMLGPRSPKSMATLPAGLSGSIIGSSKRYNSWESFLKDNPDRKG